MASNFSLMESQLQVRFCKAPAACPPLKLSRSRSETAVFRKKPVIADYCFSKDANVNQLPTLLSRNSTFERSVKKCSDEEVHSLLSRSQKTPPRSTSTSVLERAAVRTKKAVIADAGMNSLMSLKKCNPSSLEEIRPSSSPSRMQRNPMTPSKMPPMMRNKFFASLTSGGCIDTTGQTKKRVNRGASHGGVRFGSNEKTMDNLDAVMESLRSKNLRCMQEEAVVSNKSQEQRPRLRPRPPAIREPTLANSAEFKSDSSDVAQVSKDLNCPLDTTKDAKSLFDRYANSDGRQGSLDRQKFGEIVEQILKTTGQQLSEADMKKKVEVSWREADRNYSGKLDWDEFAIWYSSWGFQQELLLSPKKIRNRNFAKKYKLSVVDADAVRAKFLSFDEDGSGTIEFPEFQKLLSKLMKIPRGQELPANKIKHFWREIDIDGSGDVCFDEFLQWYIKYFDMNGNSEISPIEQLYKSVRPNCRRTM